MKIAYFKRAISPELGTTLSGYFYTDYSEGKLDDLYMTGLCCDDGVHQILIISFDLLALDAWVERRIRKNCAAILHIPESSVLLSCTHTHGGPQTIMEATHEASFHTIYVEKLERAIAEETAALAGKFVEVDVYFYSANIAANQNRRYVSADNRASYLPYRAEMRPIANGFTDQELGSLYFYGKGTCSPVYSIGNFAAHPLASHAPGFGGRRISADFPGVFRSYVTAETGSECMYITGAAGDMIPKEDEIGSEGARQIGLQIGKAHLRGMLDAQRNPKRFLMPDPKVGSLLRTFSAPLRLRYRNNPERLTKEYLGSDTIEVEMQFVSIGDIAFVGLAGEPCAELGMEIKWHSPFRRTFIAYGATGYVDYIVPANFLVAGGYEARMHRFSGRNTIDFVKAAVDGLFELREQVYPSPGSEKYPDYLDLPLVNIIP